MAEQAGICEYPPHFNLEYLQVDVTSKTEGRAFADATGVPLLVKYDTRLRDQVAKGIVDDVTQNVEVGVAHRVQALQQGFQRFLRGCAARTDGLTGFRWRTRALRLPQVLPRKWRLQKHFPGWRWILPQLWSVCSRILSSAIPASRTAPSCLLQMASAR